MLFLLFYIQRQLEEKDMTLDKENSIEIEVQDYDQ